MKDRDWTRVSSFSVSVRLISTGSDFHIAYSDNVLQVEEYQGMLENSGLVGYAQEVLKETDQSCFVQTAKQLHVR